MHQAAQNGNEEIIKLLISKNVPLSGINTASGHNCLMVMLLSDKNDMLIQFLKESDGSDITKALNQTDV